MLVLILLQINIGTWYAVKFEQKENEMGEWIFKLEYCW